MSAVIRRIAPLVAVLMVLPVMAGWLSPGASSIASCDRFAVPHARGGDRYTYDAEGPYRDLWYRPIVDWRATNPRTDQDRGSLVLPDGSSVEIFVRNDDRKRVNLLGELVPAFQVTYWAKHPDEDNPLPFQDEWIDAETGRLVQTTNRAYGVAYNGTVQKAAGMADERHFSMFMTPSRPGYLIAQHFWGLTLWEGRSGNHSWSEVPLTPETEGRVEYFNWTVNKVHASPEGQSCVAELSLKVRLGLANGMRVFDVDLVLASDVPVPDEYRWTPTWGPTAPDPTDLRLREWSPGSGDVVPSSRDVPDLEEMGPTTLDRRPLRDGFVADRGDAFATDYDEALEAILEDPETQAWLEDHPSAVPADVEHTPGPPPTEDVKATDQDSQVVDQWSLTWMPTNASDGTELNTVYWKERVLPVVGGGTEEEVSVHVFNGTELADPPDNATTLASLRAVYRRHTGRAPPIVSCGWDGGQDHCYLGTPDATRSDGPGHIGYVTGLVLWYERGWLHSEHSYDDRAAGPPAGADTMSDGPLPGPVDGW